MAISLDGRLGISSTGNIDTGNYYYPVGFYPPNLLA